MNILSRTITGGVMIFGGLFLSSLPLFFSMGEGSFAVLIYGIPILVIGFFILFNRNEDKIERIRQVDSVKHDNAFERRKDKK